MTIGFRGFGERLTASVNGATHRETDGRLTLRHGFADLLEAARRNEVTIEAWALFCLTEMVLCLNPGPSALVVMSQSLTSGPSAGVRATAGVISANAIYFAVSASGLVALHSISQEAFSIIKWGGAAYLIWLGVTMILRSFGSAVSANPSGSTGAGRGSPLPHLPRADRWRSPDRGGSGPSQNRARVGHGPGSRRRGRPKRAARSIHEPGLVFRAWAGRGRLVRQ